MSARTFDDEGMAHFSNPLDEEGEDVFDAEPRSGSKERSKSPSARASTTPQDPTAVEEEEEGADVDEISLIKTMTLALTLQGVGDWVVQAYTISAFFLALSLLGSWLLACLACGSCRFSACGFLYCVFSLF